MYVLGGIVIITLFVLWLLSPSSDHTICNVAYIPVHGELVTYIPASEGTTTDNSYDQTASEDVTQSIRTAEADSSIKGIMLAIDSPGGSPVAGEEIQAVSLQTGCEKSPEGLALIKKLRSIRAVDGDIFDTYVMVKDTDPNYVCFVTNADRERTPVGCGERYEIRNEPGILLGFKKEIDRLIEKIS